MVAKADVYNACVRACACEGGHNEGRGVVSAATASSSAMQNEQPLFFWSFIEESNVLGCILLD